mmetsp:Transcript_21602/g.42435  ORF Transcript_21602/g.42435 Transcript_21602/m.42435 type:complete len:299 (-) Transcript_21602:159-1055(-)
MESLLVAKARAHACACCNDKSFVIKVHRQVSETLTLLANEVLHRDLDLIKRYLARVVRVVKLCLHLANLDTRHVLFNQQARETTCTLTASANKTSPVIRNERACDPLLLAVYNVVVALAAGSRANVCYVGTSPGLGNHERAVFLACNHIAQNLLLDIVRCETHDRRQCHRINGQLAKSTATTRARKFLPKDKLVKRVKVIRASATPFCRIQNTRNTGFVGLGVQFKRVELIGIEPVLEMGHNLLFHESTNLVAEFNMGLFVVRRWEPLAPIRFRKGELIAKGLKCLWALLHFVSKWSS